MSMMGMQDAGHFNQVVRDKWLKWSLIYLFFAGCFICPPRPFVEMGVTIQGFFHSWIGSEHDHYVYHHIRRSYATVVTHALIVIVYLVLCAGFFGQQLLAPVLPRVLNPILAGEDPKMLDVYNRRQFGRIDEVKSLVWWLAMAGAVVAVGLAEYWRSGGWKRHPIVKELMHYNPDWHATAGRISAEFKRMDNLFMTLGGQQVVVTDSWVLSVATYTMFLAHQNDVDLAIVGTQDVRNIETGDLDQILTIRLNSVRTGSRPFKIRLESIHFEELELKVAAPVRNMKDISIRQTLSEQFLEAFRAQVEANGRVTVPEQDLDRCVGCMNCTASARLTKRCTHDGSRQHQCSPCMCRPMWCLECLGKWFASKQNQFSPDEWMAGQAECPTCRAKFCMHDILGVGAVTENMDGGGWVNVDDPKQD